MKFIFATAKCIQVFCINILIIWVANISNATIELVELIVYVIMVNSGE